MRRAPNRDKGEPAIIDALQSVGATVQQLDAKGVPDLLVGYRGRNYLLECKAPAGARGGAGREGQKLNADQERWHAMWNGQVATVHGPAEALAIIGVELRSGVA